MAKKSSNLGTEAMQVPLDVKRLVLQESDYKCANPYCRQPLNLEVCRIWRPPESENGLTSNLLCVCPNCHLLIDSGRVPISTLRAWKMLLVAPPETSRIIVKALIIPGDRTKEGLLVKGVSKLWFELLRMIQADPDSIHQIDCWKWEELLAGAYKQDGWETVVLTPKRGDHGIDVIAERSGWGQLRFLLLDQMKAYKPGHLIGPDEIRDMKGVLLDHPEASKGLITTTANFTPGAIEAAANLAPRLELRPRDKLVEWLASVAVEDLQINNKSDTEIEADA